MSSCWNTNHCLQSTISVTERTVFRSMASSLWVRNEWLGCTSARRGRLLRLSSGVSKGSEILFCFCADSCHFLYINLESLRPDIELMRLGPPIERNSSLLISYADKQWTFESPLPLSCIFFKLWAMRWWDGFILIN